jgi:hypothetical protein
MRCCIRLLLGLRETRIRAARSSLPAPLTIYARIRYGAVGLPFSYQRNPPATLIRGQPYHAPSLLYLVWLCSVKRA